MTIVVDTSALAAVVFGEPDAAAFVRALGASSGDVSISAATLVESRMVVEGREGPEAVADLTSLLDEVGVDVVTWDAVQADLATTAWRRFGKGRHPAALNFGDCFSYALAKHLGAPLLFKGDDFRQTDIGAVL